MDIALGAEARIFEKNGNLVKERIEKKYRLQQIDERLRSRRTKLESNLLREAKRIGVHVPRVFDITKFSIEMENISGSVVKDVLDEKNFEKIGNEVGRQIALLHEYNIIHGDLTTSNMILASSSFSSSGKNSFASQSYDICFIDFGLGFVSQRIEDKTIDLYLLYHSIEATHWNLLDKFWKIILNSYKAHFKEAHEVIKTLDQIEKRGRYKKRSD